MAEPEAFPRTKAHQRYYVEDDGKRVRVPGATTVTGVIDKSRFLVPWANRLGLDGIDSSKHRDAAADVGTLAHAMVEAHLRGVELDLREWSADELDRAGNALLAFHAWEDEHDFEPLLLEEPLVSDVHRYGGTIDAYGMLDGKHALLDLKTSKAVYREHRIQVAGGYRRLLREHGYEVDEVWILRIGRTENEGFEDVRIRDIDACERAFLAARELYEALKAL